MKMGPAAALLLSQVSMQIGCGKAKNAVTLGIGSFVAPCRRPVLIAAPLYQPRTWYTSPDNRQDVHRATATRSRRSLQYFRIEASIRGTVSLFPKRQSDEQDRPRAGVFRSLESHAR